MEKKSFYWWVIYVFISSTVLMMCVYIVRKNLVNSKINYPISFVNKFAFTNNEIAIKNLACDTVDSMAIFKKILNRVKNETKKPRIEDKIGKSITKENKAIKRSKMVTTDARERAKAKALTAYLRNRRIGRGITNSQVIISETSIASVAPHKSYNEKAEEKVQTYAKASKRPINDRNSKFVSQNNISLSSTADYKVVNSEKNQEHINSNDITINQSNDIETEMTNSSSSKSISTLLKTYNQYQSIRNSTISYTVDGNLEFVDITSTDLISNQVPENNINSPLASKPMGAKNAEDPLDGGGGVDNGTVYNDSGGGPSLPVGDGTLFLIVLSIIFISFKNFKHNFKTY